eukprot:TRINITY_DN1997_c1_g1_i2.p2 TRINITY_DN1997_c1_g1~~TRINITY_DN1997_c1_g1_i2.p2  ORF type:complete len:305 (+),score=104.89 TRINITY_DN1997_c1_g1_i2:250-1164(+)
MVGSLKSSAGMPLKEDVDQEIPFVDVVPEDLQCGICFGPCLEPHVTEECGHLFCKGCVSTALEVKSECPICRVSVTQDQVRKDVRTQRKIAGLHVFCKYRKAGGCTWQGVLSDLERHAEKCDHALVPCPFTAHGCDMTVTRNSLAEHLQTAMSSHMVLAASALTRLQEEQLTLQQEIEILQRHDQRFIWVIPNFMYRKAPAYSRKFTAKSHQWYLGVDFDGPDQHAGVYLFADGHNRRVDYKLILFNQDPRKDKNHSVNDWTAEYKGKGWGPLKFIDRPNLGGTGFLVNGCVRLAVEVEGLPFD